MKFDLYNLYLLPKAINWCPERMNSSTKHFLDFWELDLGGTFWKILKVLLLLIFFLVKRRAKKVAFYEKHNIFLCKRVSSFILI